jgi:hypothetical protein
VDFHSRRWHRDPRTGGAVFEAVGENVHGVLDLVNVDDPFAEGTGQAFGEEKPSGDDVEGQAAHVGALLLPELGGGPCGIREDLIWLHAARQAGREIGWVIKQDLWRVGIAVVALGAAAGITARAAEAVAGGASLDPGDENRVAGHRTHPVGPHPGVGRLVAWEIAAARTARCFNSRILPLSMTRNR